MTNGLIAYEFKTDELKKIYIFDEVFENEFDRLATVVFQKEHRRMLIKNKKIGRGG